MALVTWSRFTCRPKKERWLLALHSKIIKATRLTRLPKLCYRSLDFNLIYLSWCIRADELFVNFLSFGGQFWWFSCLVVLTSQIESNVFLTELWNQECSEEAQSIWRQERDRERGELTSGSQNKTCGLIEAFASGVMLRAYFDWTTVCQMTPSISKAHQHLNCRKIEKHH